MKKVFEKMVAIVMMSVPDPLNKYHEMNHNSTITCQNQLEISDQKVKHNFNI